MQSSFNVPELQPFMVDNCCSPLFSVSTADHLNNSAAAASSHAPPKHHHHHPPPPQVIHHHHHHPQQRFLHSVPITQQFFEQYNSFHTYEQQRRLHHQLGLDQDLNGSDNPGSAVAARIVNGGGPPAAAFLASNFKLGVNVNESGGGGDDDEGLLRGDDGSDGHRWQREEDSSIKEPFWKPLEIDYINRNNNDTTTTNNNNNNSDGHNNDNLKRFRDKLDTASIKYYKKAKESNYNTTTTPNDDDDDQGNHSGSNYGMFGELEAIYTTHGSSNAVCGARVVAAAAAAAVVGPNNHQAAAGSGSALTIENHPPAPQLESRPADESIGEEAPSPPPKKAEAVATHQKLRKKKPRRHLSSMVSFFESLMNKLTEQQESLHKAFLDTMERRDRERAERHEAWRQQEAARAAREAAVRAQERTLASAREAAIVSFLERFTGETINFPTFDEPNKENNKENNAVMDQGVLPNSNRWPKAEVQALIQVRSGLETRFQEPGLKGPLWEEVSASMGRLGYRRSAKRCKEKWENINKYFKKTKDSMKKRPQHTKTCPYFHQLDQLYSQKASNNANNNNNNAELLQAMIASAEKNESPRDAEAAGKGLLELGRGDREEDDEGDDEEGEGEEERENSHSTLLFGLES
ncbi:Trihelix transcription factor GT-2 [Acorus calamus]|uniref:Trihelix transcription factor GT-2 n=1 Tax=Acorus calamus TaxID=4465 RepID=A0AAV9D7D4_ACOCL|nr:Trihelix transcription factor GT-2 [Acorus calamus]